MRGQTELGFTLIELLISITLGLLLVAVAVQLAISGHVNYRIQQAASTIQDTGVFSMNAVTRNIRLANYGNVGAMNDQTLYGGIVVSHQTTSGTGTSTVSGNLKDLKVGGTLLDDIKYISNSTYNTSGIGPDKSDQLVISYQAPENIVTCTGRNVKGIVRDAANFSKGWYVVERYYINYDSVTQKSALNCSDAFFVAKSETVPQTLGTGSSAITVSTAGEINADYATNAGEMIAPNVEFMRVKLRVRYKNNSTGEMDIDDYKAIPLTTDEPSRPAIIGVSLGWLIRSSDKVEKIKNFKYTVLDTTITVPDDGYLRHVYSTTVALRNGGLGAVIE